MSSMQLYDSILLQIWDVITWNDEKQEFYYYAYIYNEPDGEKYYTEYSTGTYSTPCKTALLFPPFFFKKKTKICIRKIKLRKSNQNSKNLDRTEQTRKCGIKMSQSWDIFISQYELEPSVLWKKTKQRIGVSRAELQKYRWEMRCRTRIRAN